MYILAMTLASGALPWDKTRILSRLRCSSNRSTPDYRGNRTGGVLAVYLCLVTRLGGRRYLNPAANAI